MTDALGFCSRATLSTYAILPKDMAMMFETGTGIKMSEKDIFEAARRVINLERSFNMREGVRRESDTLPWRVMNEPIKSISGEESMNSVEELNNMLDQYYKIREWDENGLPRRETLKKYGLDAVIKEGDYYNGN
jgi:aldehyde:ferredoxin oxidoreductase